MKGVVLFLSIIIFPFCHADTLKGVKGVEILAIDGKKIQSNVFNNSPIVLTEGHHQVVVKYAKRFRSDKMLNSKPHIFGIEIMGTQQSVSEISIAGFKPKTR